AFVLAIAGQLSKGCADLSPDLIDLSVRHGCARYEQGYSAPMLVEENRILCSAILDCVQDNLLIADVSNLVPDLKVVTDVLASMLREAITSHNSLSQAA